MVASPAAGRSGWSFADGRAYWTVVDDEYVKVAVADRFLFDLRFGRDRAESTTRVYAGELARFLTWCAGTGRSLEDGARHLSRFVLLLRTTATERAGAGQGRPPGAARINHVLAVVREFFKHAVAGEGGGRLGARLPSTRWPTTGSCPAELRPEGRGLRYRARPRHRLRTGGPLRRRQRRRPSGRRCSRLRPVAGPLPAGAVVVLRPADRRDPRPAARRPALHWLLDLARLPGARPAPARGAPRRQPQSRVGEVEQRPGGAGRRLGARLLRPLCRRSAWPARQPTAATSSW